MKRILFLLSIIFCIFSFVSCSVTRISPKKTPSEAIQQIEKLPANAPELTDFDRILSDYDRGPSRGIKMSYQYHISEGYGVVVFTHPNSFAQAEKIIDDIINGKKSGNREGGKILITKCIVSDPNGKEVFSREWK